MDRKMDSIGVTTMELADLMNQNPNGIERNIVTEGENLVGLFQDENFTVRRYPNLNEQKIDIIKRAIEDISSGVTILRSSTLGLSYGNGKILPYVSPHGTLPSGVVIFSISWKNVAAFKAWRFGEGDDVNQDHINAAIYFLTAEISALL